MPEFKQPTSFRNVSVSECVSHELVLEIIDIRYYYDKESFLLSLISRARN